MRKFVNKRMPGRLAVVPFEAAVAMLLIISGATSILRFGVADAVYSLLPWWESALIDVMSMGAGLCMIGGIALGLSKIESAGLWMLNAVVTSRFILFGYLFGYKTGFIQTGLFEISVVMASFVRLRAIRNRHVLLKIMEYEPDETSS